MMNSTAMEKMSARERLSVEGIRTAEAQLSVARSEEGQEHCGETALYPLSPVSMALYYAFLPEFDIE